MKNFKPAEPAEIIMLTSTDASPIIQINKESISLAKSILPYGCRYKNIFITTNEPVSVGDICLLDCPQINNPIIVVVVQKFKDKFFFKTLNGVKEKYEYGKSIKKFKKIFATTDKMLTSYIFKPSGATEILRELPENFIEYFVEEYNKNLYNSTITTNDLSFLEHFSLVIKNNNIEDLKSKKSFNMKLSKQYYSKEELKKIVYDIFDVDQLIVEKCNIENLDKYLDEKL